MKSYKMTHKGRVGSFTGDIPVEKGVFNKKCILMKLDVVLGEEFIYVNNGTKASPKFEVFKKSGGFLINIIQDEKNLTLLFSDGVKQIIKI